MTALWAAISCAAILPSPDRAARDSRAEPFGVERMSVPSVELLRSFLLTRPPPKRTGNRILID
jgi:hypothetical protein